MLLNKWQFNTNQNLKVLEDNFDSISSKTISNATLQALGFHYFFLSCLKKKVPWFVNITNKPELAIAPENNG